MVLCDSECGGVLSSNIRLFQNILKVVNINSLSRLCICSMCWFVSRLNIELSSCWQVSFSLLFGVVGSICQSSRLSLFMFVVEIRQMLCQLLRLVSSLVRLCVSSRLIIMLFCVVLIICLCLLGVVSVVVQVSSFWVMVVLSRFSLSSFSVRLRVLLVKFISSSDSISSRSWMNISWCCFSRLFSGIISSSVRV